MSMQSSIDKGYIQDLLATKDDFDSLSDAQKRVRLAREVLEQVKIGKLIPSHGLYLREELERLPTGKRTSYIKYKQLGKQERCWGCALGGLFFAWSKEGKPGEDGEILSRRHSGIDGTQVKYILRGFFDPEQLDLIEIFFEGIYCFTSHGYMDGSPYKSQFPNSSDRLVAIMNNIIKNEGTFIP